MASRAKALVEEASTKDTLGVASRANSEVGAKDLTRAIGVEAIQQPPIALCAATLTTQLVRVARTCRTTKGRSLSTSQYRAYVEHARRA
jgi:hypothetical protein